LDLLQESLRNAPWLLLQSAILLNRTRGSSIQLPMESLFADWPTPEMLARAPVTQVAKALSPLGLQNRRANSLVGLARAWCDRLDGADWWPSVDELVGLPGIGQYALDSYRIFVDDAPKSKDPRLTAYCEWARTGKVPVLETSRRSQGSRKRSAAAGSEAEAVLKVLEVTEGWQVRLEDGSFRGMKLADAKALVGLIVGAKRTDDVGRVGAVKADG
jgi:hypothetical protein